MTTVKRLFLFESWRRPCSCGRSGCRSGEYGIRLGFGTVLVLLLSLGWVVSRWV